MRSSRLASHARWVVKTGARIFRWRTELRPWVKSPTDNVRLTVVTFGLVARLVGVKPPLPWFGLTLASRRHRVYVANHHELAGATEVLCTPDYDIPLEPREVHRVLDLGANAGFATLLFASRYPTAEIVALEPAPDTYERLSRNVGHLSNVRLMPFAAGAPGSIMLDLAAPSTERSSRHPTGLGHEVRRLGLDELLGRLGWDDVDVLKIDIEGDEYALLSDPSIEKAGVIVGELHAAAAPSGFRGLTEELPGFEVTHGSPAKAEVTMFRAVRRLMASPSSVAS